MAHKVILLKPRSLPFTSVDRSTPNHHYYRDGRSLCGQSDRRGGPLQAGLPDSTPFGDPVCPRCREMLHRGDDR